MKKLKNLLIYIFTIKLVYCGTVSDLIDYQLYKDFAMNRGDFKVGAVNVKVTRKDGSFKIIEVPILDFSSTDSSAVGTLIDPNYVGGVQHNVGYTGVTYGYNTGHSYKMIDRNEIGLLHAPRLSKVVTDVAPTNRTEENLASLSINELKEKYAVLARVGSGMQYVQGEDGKEYLAYAYNYLTGGLIDPNTISGKVTWSPGNTDIMITGRDNAFEGILDSSALPIYLEPGDSGSPLWGFNIEKQEWELIGFAQSISGGNSLYTLLNNEGIDALIAADYLPEIEDIKGAGETVWGAVNIEEGGNKGIGTITQGDKTWTYNGLKSDLDLAAASDEELNYTKHLTFAGEGGTIKLEDSINMGAGKLTFKNNYTVKGDTGKETWVGAGIQVDKGSEVLWQVNGVKGDALHKIGEGTLHVNATGKNEGALNVGDGTVILDQQADENGDKQVFEYIDIVSGRATVVLKDSEQIDTSKINFGFRGGRLDVNGNEIAFGDINATDSGAMIVNHNSDEKAIININTDKFKNESSIYHGQFGEYDENRINGEMDVNISGSEEKNFAITGGTHLNGDINVKDSNTNLILSGGRDLHAGEKIKDTTVNGDYYYSEFNVENINLAEGAKLQESVYAVVNGDINTTKENQVVIGYLEDETQYIYDETQDSKTQNAIAVILSDLAANNRFNEITTFHKGDINLQENSELKAGYAYIEGEINSKNSEVSLKDSKLKGSIITDSQSSVDLKNSEWNITKDSEVGNLKLEETVLVFDDLRETGEYHTLKANTMSGNGAIFFNADMSGEKNDKVIVEKVDGELDLKLDIRNINSEKEMQYGKDYLFMTISDVENSRVTVSSFDGKNYIDMGPVRVQIQENKGDIVVSTPDYFRKETLSDLSNAVVSEYSARVAMLKNQSSLLRDSMYDMTEGNFQEGATYIGNYSDSKYESDKFREYKQSILTHGFTYETVEEQNTGHTLYNGKAFIYGRSNIDYDGDFTGNIENYSLHSYSKLYNDKGYFVKRIIGVNYLDSNINSSDFKTYSGNFGTGFGMDRDLKYMKLTTGIDLTLYYLPEVSYSLEDRHNDEYRVTSNREIIFEINPEVRAETEFLLQKMRINTYGTVSYEMNKYLLNNAPKMDIHDISTTSGVAERGAVTKIGTDIKIQNIGLGLELKYFSGEYNAEKVTGTVKASYKF